MWCGGVLNISDSFHYKGWYVGLSFGSYVCARDKLSAATAYTTKGTVDGICSIY
jgi:hypothetical protein